MATDDVEGVHSMATIADVIKRFPGLAEVVGDATRIKSILDGMPPEHREAMEPVIRRIVRGKTDDANEKK